MTSGSVPINVKKTIVHNLYSGEVVDENDIAILELHFDAPNFAKVIGLSSLTDLTSVIYTIAGYGARSTNGGGTGTLAVSNANTGRLRDADNRFDWRFRRCRIPTIIDPLLRSAGHRQCLDL